MARKSLLALLIAVVCTHSGGVHADQSAVVSSGLPQFNSQVALLRGSLRKPIVPPTLNWRAMAVNAKAGGGQLNGSTLYRMIPFGVRLAGPEAVSRYLISHHLSHIRSVRRHPRLVAHPSNLVFEPAPWNLARGAKDMTLWDRLRVRAHNGWKGGTAAARALSPNVARGAGIGMVLALPVELVVGTLNVRNGRVTVPQAVLDGATTLGVFGLTGGAAAGAVTVAGASGFTLGAPVVVPLMVVGGTVYVLVSAERIWDALGDETRAMLGERGTAARGVVEERARAVGGAVSDGLAAAGGMAERVFKALWARAGSALGDVRKTG